MRRLLQWPNRIRIRDRLVAYFLLAILLPTLLIAWYLYGRTDDILTKKMSDQARAGMVSVSALMREKLNFINDMTTLINVNSELQGIFMAAPPSTTGEIVREITALDRILESYYLTSNYLFLGSGVQPKLYMVDRAMYNRVSASTKVFDIGEIAQEPWYQRLTNRFTIVGLTDDPRTGRENGALRIARRMYNTKLTETVVFAAVLVVDVDIKNLLAMLTPYKPTPESAFYVLDDARTVLVSTDLDRVGTVLAAAEPSAFDDGVHVAEEAGKKQLITAHAIPGFGMTVYGMTPLDQINAERIAFNRTFVGLLAGSMLAALVIALLMAQSIASPIQKLARSMQEVPNEDLRISIHYKRQDEFGALIDHYREMIAQIRHLIQELYVKDLRQKEAELKQQEAELVALQAQINPHFLYNTLDAINLYAIRHQVPQISEMISALSDFFRYGLSKGKRVIPLSDELVTVESYLKIQKVRLREQIDYTMDIAEETRGNLIAKMVIQPLVENAIVHGIQPAGRPGHIVITARREGEVLRVAVEDDGVGADMQELHDMLATDIPAVRKHSFGIRNVNDRIRMLFGDAYGLRFEALDGAGCRAVLILPNIRSMEGYHAQHDNSR